MPTYNYRCTSCEHEFEEFQRITDNPLDTCPKCGEKKIKRLITGGSGFVLKGSGFYSTDYRSSSYQEGAKKAEADAKSSTPPLPKSADKKAKK